MSDQMEAKQQEYATGLNTPRVAQSRELENFLDRLETQNSRLANLGGRLSEIRCRLTGADHAEIGSDKRPPASGLLALFDEALSENSRLINQIDDLTQSFETVA